MSSLRDELSNYVSNLAFYLDRVGFIRCGTSKSVLIRRVAPRVNDRYRGVGCATSPVDQVRKLKG